ncbi:MAG: hypothetical protein Q4D34_07745, partial [Eggerthellaceae bacterium]|nr:hypothetical protein [Eggerthellaceae bacterium]
MLDTIRIAVDEDFEAVWQLYVDVCERIPDDRYSPGWKLGLFPSREIIRNAIEAETLRVGITDRRIGAAMVLLPEDDEGHAGIAW